MGVVQFRGECRAVGPHQPGDIGPNHSAFRQQFEGAQHRVVEESAALHHDFIPQVRAVFEFYHLIQRVSHHRIGKPRRDGPGVGAFFLSLFHQRIHENCAACPQINRVGALHGQLSKFLHRGVHGGGESLQEGTTSGGARLVHCDRVHHAVFDFDELHVLAADIHHRGHSWRDVVRGAEMRHGLHYAFVEAESRRHQSFAVTGRAGATDDGVLGQVVAQPPHDFHRSAQGVALVRGIVSENNAVLRVNHHCFYGGGTRVDSQPAAALSLGNRGSGYLFLLVSALKVSQFLFVSEQRAHPSGFVVHFGDFEPLD